jgi:ATP-dependent helicase/nuclease subunit A
MSSGYRVYDKDDGCIRPVKYRDIVILLRTVSGGIDATFRRALEAKGIPAYVAQKSGYFDTLEVREILNFLNVIDNPVNDIALYGTMVSYFGGFTKEEAALIKSWEKAGDSAAKDTLLKEKLSSFYELINKYRDMATYMPVRELISNMITDTGYLEYVTALSGGNQRRANVLMLLERATDFENTSFHGLFRFIRYIEGLKAKEVDYGEISITDEASDLVRIITDHSSKGLEFPIVFVSCLGKRFNFMDSRRQFVLDDKLGIGAGMVDTERRCKRKTLIKSAVALKNNKDTIAEEMRILYVALTRAREKLILTATIDAKSDMEKISKTGDFDSLDVLNAQYYTDMILPVLASKDMIPAYTKIYTASDIAKSNIEENVEGITKKQLLITGQLPCDEELLNLLKNRFNNKYPYEKLSGLYLKTSVSDIKHEAYEDQHEEKLFENQEKKPYVVSLDDTSENQIDDKAENRGALRGSAYHRLMELTPFEKIDDLGNLENIRSIIEDTRSKNEAEGKLSKEFNQLINTDKILNFYKTNLAGRMVKAAKVGGLYKEAPFFLGVNANRVKAEFPEDEIMLVQGIIDAYFEEEDYLVLMDYKTDTVADGAELISRYKVQLDIYAEALERITGKKVKEKIIYSFALGSEIPVI